MPESALLRALGVASVARAIAWMCALLCAGVATAQAPAEQGATASPGGDSVATVEASAGDKERAIELFKRALQLYEEGDFQAAVFEFEKAYETAPNYKVLYNIATTYLNLHKYAKAYTAYERYLQDGGGKISQERKSNVMRQLATLENRVARLTLRTEMSGAKVEVDEELVGTTPLEKEILVKLGRRRITVTKPGYIRWSQMLSLAGGQKRVVDVALVPEKAPQAAAPTKQVAPKQTSPGPTTAQKKDKNPYRGVWIATGVSATFLVATAITGGLSLRAQNQLDDARNTFPADQDTIASRSDKAKRLSIATDTLGGLGIAAGVVAISLFIKNRIESKRSSTKETAASTQLGAPRAKVQSIAPTLGKQQLGLALRGSF